MVEWLERSWAELEINASRRTFGPWLRSPLIVHLEENGYQVATLGRVT